MPATLRSVSKSLFLMIGLWLLISANAHTDALDDLYVDTLTKAETGSSTAMYDLAGMYLRGVGTSKDINEALVWYQEAAQLGYSTASYKLGTLYNNAIIVPRDAKQSFRWFKKAADQGHKKARAKVSAMYFSGDGIAKNRTAADEYSRPAKKAEPTPKAVVKTVEKQQKKTVTKKPSKKNNAATIDRIANQKWTKRKRAALYLPSVSTHCNKDTNNLVCISKKIPGQQFNKSYTYRVRSTLKNFTPDGHFDAAVDFQLVDISSAEIEGYGQEDDDTPRANTNTIVQELKKKSEQVSCDLSGDKTSVTCISTSGRKATFNK